MSEAISIPYIGISVQLPNGNGWKSEDKWSHDEDSLTINSVFTAGSTSKRSQVRFVYRLFADRKSPAAWLGRVHDANDSASPEQGLIETQAGQLHWIYVTDSTKTASIILATMQLDHGRWLDVEVTQLSAQSELVHEVFKAVSDKIRVEDTGFVQVGIDVVGELKLRGLSKTSLEKDEPVFYRVLDSGKKDIGYLIDIFFNPLSGNGQEPTSAAYAFLLQNQGWSRDSVFFSSDKLEEFTWRTKTLESTLRQRLIGRTRIQQRQMEETVSTIYYQGGNRIRIEKHSNDLQVRNVEISDAAVAGVVLEAVYVGLLSRAVEQAVVDVIDSDGKVEPALIKVLKKPFQQEKAAYGVRTEYIGSGLSYETYFDEEMRVIGKNHNYNGIIILERTDIDEIISGFSDQADFILQKAKALLNREF